jgi:flagellar basal-body rod protein FlgB
MFYWKCSELSFDDFIGCRDPANFDDQAGMLPLSQYAEYLHSQARLAEHRQRVIAHNIANVNTPGFKTLDLIPSTNEASSSGAESKGVGVVQQLPGLAERADGNNVDVDSQIAESNKNVLLYQTYLQLLAGQISQFRQALRT